jgi:hypothetical protein
LSGVKQGRRSDVNGGASARNAQGANRSGCRRPHRVLLDREEGPEVAALHNTKTA